MGTFPSSNRCQRHVCCACGPDRIPETCLRGPGEIAKQKPDEAPSEADIALQNNALTPV